MQEEERARINHKSGNNCAMSVFLAYADRLGLSQEEARQQAPPPREEGGKCGAFLAGKKILEQLKPEAVEEFERRFTETNGQTVCSLLIASHKPLGKTCNDYVGDAARILGEVLES